LGAEVRKLPSLEGLSFGGDEDAKKGQKRGKGRGKGEERRGGQKMWGGRLTHNFLQTPKSLGDTYQKGFRQGRKETNKGGSGGAGGGKV